ncbi:hypothetical protein [Pedobacter sp. NJ-S-72]
MMENLKIIGITPFEKPDTELAIALIQAGIFPVINLGYQQDAAVHAVNELIQRGVTDFGVCFPSSDFISIILPAQVSLIIIPYDIEIQCKPGVKLINQSGLRYGVGKTGKSFAC